MVSIKVANSSFVSGVWVVRLCLRACWRMGVGVNFFPLVRTLSGWLSTVKCATGVHCIHTSKEAIANVGDAQNTMDCFMELFYLKGELKQD